MARQTLLCLLIISYYWGAVEPAGTISPSLAPTSDNVTVPSSPGPISDNITFPTSPEPTKGFSNFTFSLDDVRLADGGVRTQGRLELLINGSWWTVCGEGFHFDEARVVCRMLSFPEPHDVYRYAEFGEGNGTILKILFDCQGNESSLVNCSQAGYYDYCSHYQDVGITCGPLVPAECGGPRTEPVGILSFKGSQKPNERSCEWSWGRDSPSSGDYVILVFDETQDSCSSSKIHVWDNQRLLVLKYYYSCSPLKTRFLELSATNVTVSVEISYQDYTFGAKYAILNDSIASAQLVEGWNITVTNVTFNSIGIQWRQPALLVRVYVALLKSANGSILFGDILPKNTSNATFTGLVGLTPYRVSVIAVDEFGVPHTSVDVLTTTKEGVPNRVPYFDCHSYASGWNYINITWYPIPQEDVNGNLLGYTISYKRQCISEDYRTINVSQSTTGYVITDLVPGYEYEVQIAGFTSVGTGAKTSDTCATNCGPPRNLTARNGTFQSPNYPCYYSYHIQDVCRWNIAPVPSETTELIWIDFDSFSISAYHTSCWSSDWLGIKIGANDESENGTLLCGYLGSFSLLLSSSEVNITFYKRTYSSGRGFHASYLALQSPITVQQVHSWNITVQKSGSQVVVEWPDISPELNVSIVQYLVQYKEENANLSYNFRVDRYSDKHYLDQGFLKGFRKYEIRVFAMTGGIENTTFSSEIVLLMTDEGVPSRPPPNVRVETVFSTVVVTWDPLHKNDANGVILGYTVCFREKWYYYSKKCLNTSDTEVTLSNLTAGKSYEFSVSASTFVGEGPRSAEHTITVGCGGILNDTFGVMNISGGYDPLRCNWTIGSAGIHPAFIVSWVQNARFSSCSDFVTVSDGNGFEIFRSEGCAFPYQSSILELPFGDFDFITAQVQLTSSYSHFVVQYFVLKQSLQSASSPESPWTITGSNTSETSLSVDWSNMTEKFRAEADFFILLLNRTTPNYKDGSDGTQLRFFNASQTTAAISNLGVFEEYLIIVYLVDVQRYVYRSHQIIVRTDEGVPQYAPYPYNWIFDPFERTIAFMWGSLRPEDARGILQGYVIAYAPVYDPSNYTAVTTGVNQTSITLTNLTLGTIYGVFIAGFTRKGIGANRTKLATLCGGNLTDENGTFFSPSFSNISLYDLVYDTRCNWHIRPPQVSMIWLTLFVSLGYTNYYGSCSGGVRIFVPASATHKSDELQLCHQKDILVTLLIQGNFVNLTADGFIRYRKDSYQGLAGHFQSTTKNLTEITGEVLEFWTINQTDVTNTSFTLSWSTLPSSFLGGSSVEKYLILYITNSTRIYHTTYADPDKTAVNVSGLQPWSNYSVKVVAILKGGSKRGNGGWMRLETAEGVPSRSPYIYFHRSLSHDTIFIKWRSLPSKDVPGVLRGYRVHVKADYPFYGETTNVTVNASQLELNLTGLRPGTYYRILVNGFTNTGEGGSNNYIYERTKCGWDVTNSTGTLESPGYKQSRIEYSDCIWSIYAPEHMGSVIIVFEHFNLPLSFECSDFYVSVNDESGIEPERLCGNKSRFTVVREGHRIDVTYYSTRYSSSWTGFLARYLVLNESISSAPEIPDWNISAVSNNYSSVSVTWTQHVPASGYSVYAYAVLCTPTLLDAGPTIGTAYYLQVTLEVPRLRPLTEYQCQVVALLIHRDTGDIKMQGSQNVTITTLEGVPSKPPANVRAVSQEPNTITVSWSFIPNYAVHGVLLGYEVSYRKAFYGGIYDVVSVLPSASHVLIPNLNSTDSYEVRVAGCTSAGCGVRSEPRFAMPACVSHLDGGSGLIRSPKFPEQYPSNTTCAWIIQPKLFIPDYQVVVVFHTFHTENIEAQSNCSNDLVRFVKYKSPSSLDLIGTFCGRKDPFAISVGELGLNSSVTMAFSSDGGLEETGFNATYYVVNDTSKIVITVPLENITSRVAHVVWILSSEVANPPAYLVLYKPADNKTVEWKFARTKQTRATLRDLEPSTEYDVQILARISSGKTYGSDIYHFQTSQAPETTPTDSTPTTPATVPVTRMYPYGDAAGDVTAACRYFPIRCCKLDIPDGGMAFFTKRHTKLHICGNGVIQFDNEWIMRWPYRFSPSSLAMLAPYWSEVDTDVAFSDGPSKVFYHTYTKSSPESESVLLKATSDVSNLTMTPLPTKFEASWALVVTWYKLRPKGRGAQALNLFNTFQVVVITDGVHSFAMYNYPENGTQWPARIIVSNQRFYTQSGILPVIGWNAGTKDDNFFNHESSGTPRTGDIDSRVGNSNRTGKLFFRLERSAGEQDGVLKCIRWFKRQPDPRKFTDNLQACPCGIRQAFFDERFQYDGFKSSDQFCVYTRFPSKANRGRRCCYYLGFGPRSGALIVGEGGGAIDNYHKLTEHLKEQHEANDVNGYQYCCVASKMCRRFYEKRPSEGCEKYEEPVWSWTWGDPHFVTLDNNNYTFNGLGEFIMVDVEDGLFQLQARTKLATGDGTATVFSEIAATEQNASIVQVGLNSEGNLRLLVDGELYDGFANLTNTSITLNGSVAVSRPRNDSFVATFRSGISIRVREAAGSLSIIFAAPVAFKGKTKGLLGTWNDNPLDDFLRPDGTVLPSNATGRQIHFSFGLLWNVTSETRLFADIPGENASAFSNYSFVPMFLDEFQFESDDLRQEAEKVCEGDLACLFDSASTKDVSVGANTKEVAIEVESESEELQNFPPRIIIGPAVVNLTVNTTSTVIVTAEDPNGDQMTFSVTGILPTDAQVSSNTTSVTITWSVTTDKIDLEFVITDSKGAALVLRPDINVCACHNQGTCVASADDEDSENSINEDEDRFQILPCVCQDGYTGSFCEADLDACGTDFQSCYPGVSCIDLPPPANISGFQCGPCPDGFEGDGQNCQDVDECSVSNGGCSQRCINTQGSFVCVCNSGYLLKEDQKTCDDVDECSPVSDCTQTCMNFPGGYNCSCTEDFKVDPSNPKNCIPKNPCQQNSTGCAHVCFLSGQEEKCDCFSGYSLLQDEKSCEDIDECKPNKSRCNQDCSNTIGGYYCVCVDGYVLGSDNFTCIDVDECIQYMFSCPDDSMSCENTQGGYNCVCQEGFELINNTCKEPVIVTTPTPQTPSTSTPVPPTPSEEEKQQSVLMEIAGLNISEWTPTSEEAFKVAMANATTKFCSEQGGCGATGSNSRRRRATNDPVFTANQIHILPGYPKQISQDPLEASIAFFVEFPPGVSGIVGKDDLVSIIKGAQQDIENVIGYDISRVKSLVTEPPSATTPTTSSGPTEKPKSNTIYYIIAGCVGGGLVVIGICLVVYACCKKSSRFGKRRVGAKEMPANRGPDGVEMNKVGSYDNQVYHY